LTVAMQTYSLLLKSSLVLRTHPNPKAPCCQPAHLTTKYPSKHPSKHPSRPYTPHRCIHLLLIDAIASVHTGLGELGYLSPAPKGGPFYEDEPINDLAWLVYMKGVTYNYEKRETNDDTSKLTLTGGFRRSPSIFPRVNGVLSQVQVRR